MDFVIMTYLFLIVLLLAVIIVFAGFGEAVQCLNKKDAEKKRLSEDEEYKNRFEFLEKNEERFEPAVQFGQVLAHTFLGVVTILIWKNYVHPPIALWIQKIVGENELLQKTGVVIAGVLFWLLVFYVIYTLGVLFPKELAKKNPTKWTCSCIYLVYGAAVTVTPLLWLCRMTFMGVSLLFGFGDDKEDDYIEDEILNMAQEGHEQGLLQESEVKMISNIFAYGDKQAKDIMTNREDIIGIDCTVSLKEAISFMLEENNSRYPVYRDNIDRVIGILHLKDALRFEEDRGMQGRSLEQLNGLLREPIFVPPTKNIDELFHEMQKKKLQMVLVLNEYGQTQGLVAMEDILEEIVGNILDEYDEDESYIEQKGQDLYIMDGKIPLEELGEKLGITFEQEYFETLNGFLISKLDRLPEPEENFGVDYQGYHFQILSVSKKMVERVLVSPLGKAKEEVSLE